MPRNDQVMELVRKELEKNPDAETQVLYDKAKKVDKAIGDFTLRQFHARYPLQVKRQRAAKGGRSKRARAAKATSKASSRDGTREAIRAGLLRFGHDVAKAESRAELVDVIAGVDSYVNGVLKKLT